MKLFCLNSSWSYSPSKIPRKNHTSSVQNLSRTCAYYYSLPWNNLVSECLVGNSEDFDISAGGELPGDLLKSDLYFFHGARFLTTLLWFYDPPKLHLVWLRFIRDVAATYYNTTLLNRPDSCHPCTPTYKWMSFMY